MTTHTVNAHGVDLSPFCGKHDPREWVREPFAQAGWLCATNGTIIVGVKCELPDTPSMPSGLKVAAMLEVAEEAAGPWHPIAAVKIVDGEVCDDCDGTGLGAGRNACRECDGEGIVECNMGHEHDCPDCDGEGEVAGEPDPDAGPCESCDGVGREPAACDLPWRTLYSLSSRLARKIALLPDAEIAETEAPEKGIPIRFAGGFGLAMPMTPRRNRG